MTNELRDELARVINDVNGATEWEEVKAIAKNDGYMVAKGIVSMRMDEAQAVIDHLTPMMKKVVEALKDAIDSHDNLYMAHFNDANGCEHDLAIIPARLALASLPACWREKESTHD